MLPGHPRSDLSVCAFLLKSQVYTTQSRILEELKQRNQDVATVTEESQKQSLRPYFYRRISSTGHNFLYIKNSLFLKWHILRLQLL